MARKKVIKASELFEPVEVDLWGTRFKLREMVGSLEDQINELWESLEESDKSLKEELPRFLEFIGLYLEPIPDEDGKKVTAAAAIKRELKADKIGISHVFALSRQLLTRGAHRPT
jgi:hypothetical protein